MNALINTVMFLIVSGVPFVGIVLAASPTPGEPALVITPLWSSSERAVAKHGGREILSAATITGTVAIFSETALTSARADGSIWFVLDAKRLSFLCGGLT